MIASFRRRFLALGLAGVLAPLAAASAPLPAAAADFFTGRVDHVSTNNIKVTNLAQRKTLSFAILPHFYRVFSSDGKTTYQMRRIKPGMTVRVEYDQHLLGARHADRITVLTPYGRGHSVGG